MRNCWQWRWLWWWLRVQWWWSWRGRCYQPPGSLEHCWSHPRSSPQIYFLEESKYCWQRPTLHWVVHTCCYKGKHKWQANKSRLGRDWSRQVMVSAEWSWQLAQDLFNPKIGFAPSANSDFFAQISLSTCLAGSSDHTFSISLSSLHRENTKSEISEPIN